MNLKKLRSKVCLLGHGEIESENRLVGQWDLPLTENGTRQAYWWNEMFQGVDVAKICYSDLYRCFQKAEIIAGRRKDAIEPMPTFREIRLGDWGGLAVAEVAHRFPEEWRNRGIRLATYRPPRGESFQDLAERVIPVFEQIVDEVREDILIVSHAGVNRVILCHLLGMPVGNVLRLGQDYGCLNLIESDGESFQVRFMNMKPAVNGQSLTM